MINVIYLGCDGFPFGFAQTQKQKMISKALVAAGAKVSIISSKGMLNKNHISSFKFKGRIENINYINTSFSAYRSDNFYIRNLLKAIGRINELLVIFLFRKFGQKNIAVITTSNLKILKYYSFILRIAGYKVVLSYEEFVSSLIKTPSGKQNKHNFDYAANKYCDAILPISNFLEQFQVGINKNIKIFKVPSLTDFDYIDNILPLEEKSNYLLYCGASAYFENVSFIIDSFVKTQNTEVELILIIHGNPEQNEKVHDYIENNCHKKTKIKVMINLEYSDLIRYYKQASVLLMPLQNNTRDIARFPHKISEYTASKTPILTNAVGEINNYFIHNHSAYIVDNFNPNLFAIMIDFIINENNQSKIVAENAYHLGRANFHYLTISKNLYNFFEDLYS